MAVADIIIISVLGLFAVIGAVRGLIRELAVLVGLAAGVLLALKFALPLALILPPASYPLAVKTPVAGLLILVAAVVLVKLLAGLFRKILVKGALKGADRFWGAVFGVLKASVIIAAALSALIISPLRDDAKVWAKNTALFRIGLNLLEPCVDGFREDFVSAASRRIEKLLPAAVNAPANAGSNAQKEVAEFFSRTFEDAPSGKIRERVRNLSPEAQRYLKSIIISVREAEEKGEDAARKFPSKIRSLVKRLPLDKVKEELDLTEH